MAVTIVSPIEIAVWGGEETPFPIGMWYVGSTSLISGDATGGDHIIQVQFQAAAIATRLSTMFSLEQFTFFATSPGTLMAARLQANNLGIAATKNLAQLNQLWTVTAQINEEGTFAAPHLGRSTIQKPQFLGSQVALSAFVGLTLTMDNVNQRLISLQAMGYMWSAAARSFLGGPKRPANSLFG